MKKIIFILLLCLIFITTGCGKKYEDVELTNGVYDYSSCIFSNKLNPISALTYDKNNKNKYYILASSFSIYDSNNQPLLALDDVFYKKANADSLLNVIDDYGEFVSGDLTRYDVYRKGLFQGYALIYKDNHAYVVEFRKIHTTDEKYQIWNILEVTLNTAN